MKREEIKAIFAEATAEQLEAVMKLNNSDIEKFKGKVTELESEINEKKETLENVNKEFEKLKTENSSVEDYKTKFEQLQTEIAEKEKTAREEQLKAERETNILNRYNAVSIDKNGKPLEWTHEAIKNDYLKKFTEALDDETNLGKSDAEIFTALTKDDGTAFKVPNAQEVFGGAGNINTDDIDDAKINSIMGIS